MQKVQVLLTDTYEVIAGSILTEYDRKILSRLYQPIIGFGSVAFFLSLNSELDGERTIVTTNKPISRLLNLMQSNCDEIVYFGTKLEAVGLLRTFVKETKNSRHFVFELLAPLTPSEFFNHAVLGLMFKDIMGEDEAERSRIYLTQYGHVDTKLREITASFKEVFGQPDLDSQKPVKANQEALGRKEGVPQLDFDFEQLYKGLQEYQISRKLITPTIANEIRVLANAYNISVYDMRRILCVCITSNNEISLTKLEQKCRDYATLNPSPSLNNVVPQLSQSGNDNLDAKLETMSRMTPLEYLTLKYNGRVPLRVDVELITDLQTSTGLTNGVMNVLLDYALFKNDNRLVKKYLERLAGSLVRSNITDPYDAMVFLNGNKPKATPQTKKQSTTASGNSEDAKADLDFINSLKAGDK